jgi:hypothetical protein
MDSDLAKEGLRRLKPLRRLAENLLPDPGSNAGRVCVLESAHYMRNQLLRDADWAGMAPRCRDPRAAREGTYNFIACGNRGSTEDWLGVPIGAWMNSTEREGMFVERGCPVEAKGLTSRRWSRTVLGSFARASWV